MRLTPRVSTTLLFSIVETANNLSVGPWRSRGSDLCGWGGTGEVEANLGTLQWAGV